ncbi:hypothetical protein HIM_03628 [Hirsutella minnesotensis 3608]|uniref:Uncharacterized protein n=1 Tax=Hirsutella minnesotensis 3608 TaxID=1043627 RepID=A0A0F7ZLX0_9HYPO|nr:hypothetical protein HIM_03628 [Hirsutella minnesotensis 3608]
MGQSLIDRIQAKLELLRLEKRYTRHRHRRSTFVSNAIYVDGEYIFQVPNTTGSSTDSSTGRVDALHGEKPPSAAYSHHDPQTFTVTDHEVIQSSPPDRKKPHRFSSMPGFGNSFSKARPQVTERRTSIIR